MKLELSRFSAIDFTQMHLIFRSEEPFNNDRYHGRINVKFLIDALSHSIANEEKPKLATTNVAPFCPSPYDCMHKISFCFCFIGHALMPLWIMMLLNKLITFAILKIFKNFHDHNNNRRHCRHCYFISDYIGICKTEKKVKTKLKTSDGAPLLVIDKEKTHLKI